MNITGLTVWLCDTYEAKNIVGGRIAAKEWRNAAYDMLVQVVMQEETIDKTEAEAWIIAEINEYYHFRPIKN